MDLENKSNGLSEYFIVLLAFANVNKTHWGFCGSFKNASHLFIYDK